MKRTPFSAWPCGVARTGDLIGDWWTPLVLREAYYGVRRFDEFQRTLKIGRNVLTQRLNRLVEEGLMRRAAYQDNPPRYDYLLTEKGRDFFPVLAAMMAWGNRWLSDDSGPPVLFHHLTCGHDTEAAVVCEHCGEPLRLRETGARLGPGYPPRWRDRAQQSGRFLGSMGGPGAQQDEGGPGQQPSDQQADGPSGQPSGQDDGPRESETASPAT